jgi:signal peptide peptidase SppA
MSRKPALRALQLALGVPWAILPESLETILSIAARVNETPEAIAEKMGQKLENTRTVTVRDGVATIPVTGPLFRYADIFTEISGATSYETLSRDFTAALNNPEISAIVFEIDSPGGEVNGVSELAEMIYAARGKKPIKAYVSGFGASGAYWLAAACDEVIAADTALLGSIGVIATFVDESMAEEDAGIRVINVISTQSPFKAADPTDAEDLERIQKTVDDLAAVFVSAVGKYRGVGEKTVLAKFGKGDVMVGQVAVEAGSRTAWATTKPSTGPCALGKRWAFAGRRPPSRSRSQPATGLPKRWPCSATRGASSSAPRARPFTPCRQGHPPAHPRPKRPHTRRKSWTPSRKLRPGRTQSSRPKTSA